MTETESSSEPTIAERLRFVATTRNVPYDLLCSALEEALGAAYRRHYGSTSAVVAFDRGTGAYTIFERRLVVETVEDPLTEVALSAAAGYELGDFVDRPVEPKGFSRLAGLEAQRVLARVVLEHERERVWDAYRGLQGTLVNGLVQRENHGRLYVLLDEKNEGCVPLWERSPLERIEINDQLVFELQSVHKTQRGPALLLSRASESFVRLLLADDAIVGAARTAGRVTKVVATRAIPRSSIDAARREIRGERIEVIRHDEPIAIARAALGQVDVELEFAVDGRYLLAITDDPAAWDDAELASQLAGVPVIAVQPQHADDVLELLEAQHASAAAAPVDPEMVAKLEAFAREREASARELPSGGPSCDTVRL